MPRTLLAVVLLFASLAQAGGFSVPIIGSRMIGRGSFGAVADDTTAIFHNPAGLARQKGYRVDLSAVTIYSHTRYRLEGEEGTLSEPIRSDKPYGVLPFAGFTGDFGSDRWRFGVAVYSPHNTGGSFPKDSPARFQLVEGKIVTLFATPTIACNVTDKFAVGAGVSIVKANAGITRFSDLEPLAGIPIAALIDINADDVGYGFDFGILYDPIDRLTLGMTYQSEVALLFHGDLDATNQAVGLTAVANVAASFRLPQSLRLAADYRFSDRFDFGIDVYWQDYSVYHDLTIELSHLTAQLLGTEIALADTNIVQPVLAHDIYGAVMGGTYRLSPRWDLSAGLLYDPSPYPTSTYSILSPDANKLGIAAGIGLNLHHVEISASFLRLIFEDRIIEDSVLSPPANGEVKGKVNTALGLQFAYRF